MPADPSAAVVGRDDEVALLDGVLGQLRAGRGRAVWVEGEPGIGKSTLVGELIRRASGVGCRVFRAAGEELAQPFPLRLLFDCLQVSSRSADPLRADIARLLRGGGRTPAADPVLAAGERLVELVDRACATGPVLLVAEDLHWADEASLLVWYQLAREVEQIPLLLVGSCRPVPRRAEVVRLRRAVEATDAVVIELGPLAEAQAIEVAGGLAGAVLGVRLRRELSQAGGNPLYLRELMDAVLRDGLVEVTAGTAELRPESRSVPVSLTAAIGRRLGFLAEETRVVLRLAALLGNEFSVTELSATAGTSAAALVPAIDEAVAAGVLSHDGARMVFRHGLIRQGMYEEIAPPVRAALHGQLARQLADGAGPIGQVARHLLAAAEAVDDWAVTWLARLPEAALHGAPQVAAELLTRAVARARPGAEFDALASRLVRVLYRSGQDGELERVAGQVLHSTTDPGLAARMAGYLASSISRFGRHEQALAVAREALDTPALPARSRGWLRAHYAVVLTRAGHDQEATRQGHRAVAEAERVGDALGAGYAGHALFLASMAQSRDAEALAHLDRGLASLGGDPESVELRVLMLGNRIIALANLDRVEECDGTLREVLGLAERAGTWRLTNIRITAAGLCYERGSWDEALVHLGSAPAPTGFHQTLTAHGLHALVSSRREDRASAAEHLEAAAEVPVGDKYLRPSAAYLTAAQAIAAEAEGDLPGAVAVLARWLDPDLGPTYNRYYWLPDLVRVALEAGDAAAARAAAEAAEADAAAEALPVKVLTARRCQAQLADDTAALLEIVGEYRRTGRPVDAAGTLEEAGVRLARAGDVPAARSALTEAARGYLAAGATWDIRRADARLREHGVRRGPRSLVKRPTSGWESLTPTEQRIAALVARGRSNPDIATELYLSRRTVQTHVSNILRKLGVPSRFGIAEQAARQRPTRSPAAAGG